MAVNVLNGGALGFTASIDITQFQQQLNRMEAQLQGITNIANKEAAAIENYAKKASIAIGSYLSISAAGGFLTDIVRVRGEFQQLEVAFQTMLGSKEKADKLLADVTQFAATTPFELTEVAGATKQLLAFGIGADKIEGTLRSLGDVAAGLSQPLGEIAYLYGTIKTAGTAQGEDIRQFAQRGIPIYQELAKVLDTNVENVKQFVSEGKVGFPEIEKAFQNMTAAGSQFGGLMEAQSKTLTGQISNLQDAWAQMLNEIGRSNEGLFADAISAATAVVKNYQTVIDILKVLVITYGSYRAAIIATNAVTAISTSLAKGYTIAETLRYQAMLLSERTMKLLNATMLSNPAVLVTTAITGLVSGLVIFGNETKKAKTAQDLLADAQKDVGDRIAETEAKIRPYVEQLKIANISEQQRVDIYNKLKEIDPKIVDGLNAKTISYQNLTANVNNYLNALRAQFKLEANKSAIQESIKLELELQKKVDAARKKREAAENKAGQSRDKESKGLAQFSSSEANTEIKVLEDQLLQQKNVTEELGKTVVTEEQKKQEAKARTLEVIDSEIKSLKDQQKQASANRTQYEEFQKKITSLERERDAITGKSADRAAKIAVKQEDQRAKKLLDLNEQIADAERDAQRSGMVKQESEIDRINQKYDDLLKKANELNAGTEALKRIGAARDLQVSNTTQKSQAEEYKKSVEERKKTFDQFEEYKVDVGAQKAKELLGLQEGEIDNYLDFVRSELDKFKNDKSIGGQIKFQFLTDELGNVSRAQVEKDRDAQLKAYLKQQEELKRIVEATQTAALQKSAIEEQYQHDVAALRSKSTGAELEEREARLKAARDQELADINNALITQSGLYRKLNQDIIGYSRERIRQEIDDLKNQLNTGKFLNAEGNEQAISPQFKKQLEDYIESLEDFYNSTREVFGISTQDIEKLAGKMSEISGVFGDLSGALEGVNSGLSDTFSTLGDITNIASSALQAIEGFAKGNIIQGIAATVKTIIGVFQIGKKVRESEKKTREEQEAFAQKVLQGEIDITQQYRERQREQVKLNTLKLKGLTEEKKLLEEQKKAVQEQYKSVLAQLQQQFAVVAKGSEKYGGFLGVGRKTRAVDIEQSLAGQSFEQLEQLYLKGQLNDKAKELFELLQKLKQEGVDIDQLLQDNLAEARQLFTGTSGDAIVDSITDGFRNGLRSAGDFADRFEDLMKAAILNSLKLQYLEEPLKEFYKAFADFSQSDSQLTAAEIATLQQTFDQIIGNASDQFDQLQQIAGLNFAGTSGAGNSLTGAVKGMTEQQADLLAGQFGGLRLTAIEQLQIASQSLQSLNNIQSNTAATVNRLDALLSKFNAYESGISKLNVKI